MENGRARVDRPVRLENVQAELSRLRLELSAWREELMALLSDGLAQGAVNWPAVRETRRHLEETVAAMRRLQAGPDSASQSD